MWDPMGYRASMIDWLVKKLLYPDRVMVREQIDQLVEENNLIIGESFPAFVYGGDLFQKGGKILVSHSWTPLLDERLHPKAVGLADRWRTLEKDVGFITQTFTKLTEKCQSWQQFRDALPDCVIQFEPSLRSMERMQHQSDFLDSSSLRFSYEMLLPRLHTYAAMHLLT